MSQLANLLPLFAPPHHITDLKIQLQYALNQNGSLLDLEWDIRSIHFIDLAGRITLLWPQSAPIVPQTLFAMVQQTPEQTAHWLSCKQDCRQYLAVPQLMAGHTEGTLVLGRLVSDVLLAFRALTGADIAITTDLSATNNLFPAATSPEFLIPLLSMQSPQMLRDTDATHSLAWEKQGEWFDVFHLELTPQLSALIVNRITSQRQSITTITRNSVVIGLIGLVLSELLLLLVMHPPLKRLLKLTLLLPLLAENRFTALAQQLPKVRTWRLLHDEMDVTIATVFQLNQRMEQLQRERETAQMELIWLADHDPLTGLPNRRLFYRTLACAIDRANRGESGGVLLFFDLDRFKDVNDISGHLVGDQLLEKIAQQVDNFIGEDGFLGRFGGDEFALILPHQDIQHIYSQAAALQAKIAQVILNTDTQRYQLSASIGIVLFPEHGNNIQTLMANADLAMYQAKRAGRGRSHLYSEQDEGRDAARARLVWTDRILEALHEDRFEVHYQPLLEIVTGRIWRAEALLRMRDQQNKLISPGLFIPIAEETGLINTLDRWVLTQAIAQLQQHPGLSLSVNLSANALTDQQLGGDVQRLIRDAGIDPARLTFEITETVAINSMSNAVKLIDDLHTFGCHFALDDFGSGFASYAYLKQLPVDDVKIDGAFIRYLDYNQEDRIFVRAIAEMAHTMGKRVIAEFVESAEILDILRELDIDFAQGYHIARPAPTLPPLT
ncbi:putative bifunctional diguanylate cyclase/phosphodiesterase [Thiospirillum jenense]|uniref:EAL domain-containing protein n=1 Tax=Thiospirillum jenense TaxID=1653858 RepID=A0A839HFG3_9GAMM|nr:EAL domain-containing protein [Thiospirillum jenense]MBB1125897.1 EAL domain-containing protein [Thiospirillum jenense]